MKFKATFDPKTKMVPFLDLMVSVDKKGFIQTDLYRKETDCIQYLLPSSCHPAHITKKHTIFISLSYLQDLLKERVVCTTFRRIKDLFTCKTISSKNNPNGI